jgi:virginiamycin B lyase
VGRIGRLDPVTGHIREIVLPAAARDPHTPLLLGGKLWFTVQQSDLYGVLDTASGRATIYQVPTPAALPYGMVSAPDGTIWIAFFGTNALGHVDPATGKLTEIRLPDPGARPRRLATDAQGHVWYSDYARNMLGTYDPTSGKFQEYPCPGGIRAAPYGIAITPDGRIWYDESGESRVVAFDPHTTQTQIYDLPTKGAIVRNMSLDPAHSRLWLALSGTGRLGRIDYANKLANR